MIAFLLKISIVYAAGVLLLYGIAALNRKLAKMTRKKPEESEHAWMEEESNPCRDDVCFFCGKVTDGWSFLCHRMHRIAGTWMTTPMKLSAMYEDEDIPIPCCEECLAASKVADAKAKRNIWIAAFSACVAVFATLMYIFHGHPGAWIVAASLAFLAGMVSHSVAGWVAKPAYRKKIEKYIDGVRSKARAADAVSCESMPIGPAGLCRTIVLPGGVAMEMVYCPPGEFMMGSPMSEAGRHRDEERHCVKLANGFWLGKYEVTQEQWKSVMGSNPSNWKGDNLPVENVSWSDCQEFIAKVNAQLKCAARLPTEAEWEYACRAGTDKSLPNSPDGKELAIKGSHHGEGLDEIAWYSGNSCVGFDLPDGYDCSGWKEKEYEGTKAGTHTVGQKAPNNWGFYDMIGNVWEWCGDWYADWCGCSKRSTENDPHGPAFGMTRVLRGGSWNSSAHHCRSACRFRQRSFARNSYCGFRLCCSATR